MTRIARFATTLAGTAAVLAAVGVPGYAADSPASTTTAKTTCYGSAYTYQGYPAGAGTYAYYPARGTWDFVSGYCNDINIKTNYTRTVRVCTHNKCHGWVKAPKGQWTVIFKNSTPLAEYYLQFKGANASSGVLAS